MTLGALVDAGASITGIQDAIRSMGLGEIEVTASPVKKFGFRATQVTIEHPPEHAHRHLHHIEEMLDRGNLADEARELAKVIFQNLGQAEAKVHGTTIEKVHFHEVGAIDSIADITGVAIAMTELGIQRVESSPVPTGCGTITIAHGKVGVPAPATAELLRGIPIASCDIDAELTTPTGAAILKTTSKAFGPMPAMLIEKIGYGSGTMDLEKQANVLRVLIGSSAETRDTWSAERDQITVLETNVDDSTPEQLAWCATQLFERGALDVYQMPTLMKKGRAGVQLTVLCNSDMADAMEEVLFCSSSSIGIRRTTTERTKLLRQQHTVQTEFGSILGKCVWLPSGQWRYSAEHDSLTEAAEAQRVSIHAVRDAATRAFNQEALAPPKS